LDKRTRGRLHFWITDTFRDTADRDYIAARLLYQHGLFQPAAWSALQAVEKYLKATLLFGGRSVKSYRHDLVQLWTAVKKLPHLKAQIPKDWEEFLESLSAQGSNRYLDYTSYFEGYELQRLDRLVWYVRRYCQDFKLFPGDKRAYPGEARRLVAAIPYEADRQLIRVFKIENGFLEKVLAQRGNPLRSALIWKNFYYGARRRSKVQYTVTMSWHQPLHVKWADLIPILEPLVYFPEHVLKAVRAHHAANGGSSAI
jgi:HEPN domain-containing protein